MRPTYRPGDLVWLDYRAAPRPGDVVAAEFPDGTVVIKRAAERRALPSGAQGWWLLGDNPEGSVDSRHRGAIAADKVRAVVRARLWPPLRRR